MRRTTIACGPILLIAMSFHLPSLATGDDRDIRVGSAEMKKGTEYVVFTGEIDAKQVVIGFDTGAPTSFISTDFAKELGLRGGKANVSVKIGDVKIDALEVSVVDMRRTLVPFGKEGARVVFGHNVLDRVLTVFDYPRNKVVFLQSASKKGYEALRETVSKETGTPEKEIVAAFTIVDNHPLVAAKVNDIPGDIYFGIDTGGIVNNTLSQTGMEALKGGQDVKIALNLQGTVFNDVRFLK